VAVETPIALYLVYGQVKNDLKAAHSLSPTDVCKILKAMISFGTRQTKPPPAALGLHPPPNGQIIVKLGNAETHWPIHWTVENRANLLSMFTDPNSTSVRVNIQPLLDKIKGTGDKLFATDVAAN